MADVVERCPDCGVVLQHPGTDKWMPVEEGTTAHSKERCLEHQLTAARAEAERWRERAERLEVELRLVLPLAKGYAAQKPTIENWALCLRAEELLKGKEVEGDE